MYFSDAPEEKNMLGDDHLNKKTFPKHQKRREFLPYNYILP